MHAHSSAVDRDGIRCLLGGSRANRSMVAAEVERKWIDRSAPSAKEDNNKKKALVRTASALEWVEIAASWAE